MRPAYAAGLFVVSKFRGGGSYVEVKEKMNMREK